MGVRAVSAIVASIGATHPWNIAGVGLDARVAAEYGLQHVVAVAGVTAQDALQVRAVLPMPGRVVQAQLDSLPPEIAAFRIGALISSENIRIVSDFLASRDRTPIVVDPVLGASTGEVLWTNASYLDDLRGRLLRLPVVVTPNLDEVALLLHLKPVHDLETMLQAARDLVENGAWAALVKGGHLAGDPADVLATASETKVFEGTRLAGNMRGTGCVLAMSLACELALGRELADAIENARAYVRKKIAAGTRFGSLQTAF
ncbi:MAG TPA: bifunctional hydroxymethylpyrimidine kinase/phosphomethylpyrimidine kinase [Candidatus Rubrimentiphilum sp.]|nr:bifunctional hydroxymethylpyrimidine kinase/phosphomethylpyrimidine kinase [Candidatus Rubrimentiphilum sp.]